MLNTEQFVDCSGVLTIDCNKGSIFVSLSKKIYTKLFFLHLDSLSKDKATITMILLSRRRHFAW